MKTRRELPNIRASLGWGHVKGNPSVYRRAANTVSASTSRGWVDPVGGRHSRRRAVPGNTQGGVQLLRRLRQSWRGKTIHLWVDGAPGHKGASPHCRGGLAPASGAGRSRVDACASSTRVAEELSGFPSGYPPGVPASLPAVPEPSGAHLASSSPRTNQPWLVSEFGRSLEGHPRHFASMVSRESEAYVTSYNAFYFSQRMNYSPTVCATSLHI